MGAAAAEISEDYYSDIRSRYLEEPVVAGWLLRWDRSQKPKGSFFASMHDLAQSTCGAKANEFLTPDRVVCRVSRTTAFSNKSGVFCRCQCKSFFDQKKDGKKPVALFPHMIGDPKSMKNTSSYKKLNQSAISDFSHRNRGAGKNDPAFTSEENWYRSTACIDPREKEVFFKKKNIRDHLIPLHIDVGDRYVIDSNYAEAYQADLKKVMNEKMKKESPKGEIQRKPYDIRQFQIACNQMKGFPLLQKKTTDWVRQKNSAQGDYVSQPLQCEQKDDDRCLCRCGQFQRRNAGFTSSQKCVYKDDFLRREKIDYSKITSSGSKRKSSSAH